jgi:hypothetical protein
MVCPFVESARAEMLSAQNSENVMSERFGLKQQVKYPNVDDTLKPVANIQTS